MYILHSFSASAAKWQVDFFRHQDEQVSRIVSIEAGAHQHYNLVVVYPILHTRYVDIFAGTMIGSKIQTTEISGGYNFTNCQIHDTLINVHHELANSPHVVDCYHMPNHHGSAYC